MSKTTTRKTLPKVTAASINMGCDPEFFFSKPEVGVIGSEAILPKRGLSGTNGGGKIVIDGVQAELNPGPSTCRETLAHNIRALFLTLQQTMASNKDGVKLDFSRSIEISKEEMAKLDKANQQLGCAPSLSVAKSKSKMGVKLSEVDGSTHLQRSAGGHIHMSGGQVVSTMIQWNPEQIVHMLDLIVGNTCVLLDRDPGNKERRKLYGRAGEYRRPNYPNGQGNPTIPGLEYRTPSNFWLISYPMMSLVFGLARTTMELVTDPVNGRLFYEEFTKAVPYAKVRHAINHNNTKLAEEIYRTIEPLLWEAIPNQQGHFPVSGERKTEFDYFLKKIETNGLEYWFKQDPMTHWTTLGNVGPMGFYSWMDREVKADMAKTATPLKKLQAAMGL